MKVLVPVQDYPYAEAQLDFVLKHSWDSDTTVKLLCVVEPSMITDHLMSISGHTEFREVLQDRVIHAEVMLHRLHEKLANAYGNDVKVENTVVVGDPKEIILATAENWHADLLILGSHGRAGLSRFLLGSVSLSVLSEAPCSVAIVRLSAEQVKIKEKAAARGAQQVKTLAFDG